MAIEKIGFICEDATTISAHFGRAPLAVVVTLDAGEETDREVREKSHHQHHDHDHSHDHDHAHDHVQFHDHAPGHHGNPTEKFAAVADCEVIIVRGAGRRAVNHAESLGKRFLLVDERSVDAALAAYRAGTLRHNPARAH